MTAIQIATDGGIPTPKVLVTGIASLITHCGGKPLDCSPICTLQIPRTIEPIASVTTSGLIAKRWQM